jgi:hypothetical protein
MASSTDRVLTELREVVTTKLSPCCSMACMRSPK